MTAETVVPSRSARSLAACQMDSGTRTERAGVCGRAMTLTGRS